MRKPLRILTVDKRIKEDKNLRYPISKLRERVRVILFDNFQTCPLTCQPLYRKNSLAVYHEVL